MKYFITNAFYHSIKPLTSIPIERSKRCVSVTVVNKQKLHTAKQFLISNEQKEWSNRNTTKVWRKNEALYVANKWTFKDCHITYSIHRNYIFKTCTQSHDGFSYASLNSYYRIGKKVLLEKSSKNDAHPSHNNIQVQRFSIVLRIRFLSQLLNHIQPTPFICRVVIWVYLLPFTRGFRK